MAAFLKGYIPAIGKYIPVPTQAWQITAVVVVFASAMLLRYRNQWGRRRRLRYYLRLIRRCKRFDHNEELEALSRIVVTICGAILAAMLNFVMYQIDKGNQEAMMLSPYRRNRLIDWEEMVFKLRSQVRKAGKKKIVPARSNATRA